MISPDFVRQFRLRLGLSQQRFGDVLGVASWRVADWERREGEPDEAQSQRIVELVRDLPSELLAGLKERVGRCELPRALSMTKRLNLQAVSPPAIAKCPTILDWVGRDLAPIATSVLREMLDDRDLQKAIARHDVVGVVATTRSVLDTAEAAEITAYRTTINYFFHDGVMFSDAIAVTASDDERIGYTPITVDEIGSDLFGDRIALEQALSLSRARQAKAELG